MSELETTQGLLVQRQEAVSNRKHQENRNNWITWNDDRQLTKSIEFQNERKMWVITCGSYLMNQHSPDTERRENFKSDNSWMHFLRDLLSQIADCAKCQLFVCSNLPPHQPRSSCLFSKMLYYIPDTKKKIINERKKDYRVNQKQELKAWRRYPHSFCHQRISHVWHQCGTAMLSYDTASAQKAVFVMC